MRYTDFHISISAEEVCRLLDGHKSTLGGELAEELEEMLPEAFERLEPQAFLGVGDTEGVLYEKKARRPCTSSPQWGKRSAAGPGSFSERATV